MMKLNNMSIHLLSILLSLPVYTVAAPGCMDNSQHLKRSFGDYKNWHYVACNCPCEKKYSTRQDGRCFQCKHLRSSIPLVQVETDPTKLVNVAGLKAYAQTFAHARQ